MSQQASTAEDLSKVGPQESGYCVREVNDFFGALADDYEQLLTHHSTSQSVHTSRTIRDKVFTPEAGGYTPQAVDSYLDQVEDRFAEVERRLYIERYGAELWQDSLEELWALLRGRLNRPDGERFRRPSHQRTKGYLTHDVDELCRLILRTVEHGETLLPQKIRSAAFRSAVGKNSYDETQVDAFMSRCLEYLQDTL